MPKEDITAYELARILPMFSIRDVYMVSEMIGNLDEGCRRHFE